LLDSLLQEIVVGSYSGQLGDTISGDI